MDNSLSVAVSGLLASAARLDASAANIANLQTTGPLPPIPAASSSPGGGPGGAPGDAPSVYQAVDVVQIDLGAAGGVRTVLKPRVPAYVARPDPGASFADAGGMVAAPAVDPATELAGQITSLAQFQADVSVIQTYDHMQQHLLSIKA